MPRALSALMILFALAVGTPSTSLAIGVRDLARNATGTSVDHAPLDALLKAHVDERGRVNYPAIARDPGMLDAYIQSLAAVDLDTLEDPDQLALLINAYNAFTIKLITEHYDNGALESIMDIPEARRWKHQRWVIAGETYSLDQIENQVIRKNFSEPRIHFALVCAAQSCPLLRRFAYTGEQLDQQLEQAARATHEDDRWARYDPRRRTLYLTRLYEWYGQDFIKDAGSIEAYAAQFLPALKQDLDRGRKLRIEFLDYSWDLNDQR